MDRTPNISADTAELRRRGEARLSQRMGKRRPGVADQKPEADPQRLLHELQVHQVELELQNEELQRARAELETLLMKYTALYDFAPTGYFTLDREETIRGLNLAGASLLGIERSKLVGRRFGLFVAAEKRPAFAVFLSRAFESGTKEVCETSLQQQGDSPRWVWIEACGGVSGQECGLAVMDITERKQAETDRARLEHQVQAASEREQRCIGERLQEDLCQRLAGVDIGLSRNGRNLTLTIADDGSGMAEPSEQGSGLGLQIMRYRSDLLGAALTIHSKPGEGTVVTCCYPVAGGDHYSATRNQ